MAGIFYHGYGKILVVNILSFFWPQVLEKVVSPISGEISKLDSRKLEIKVIEQFGKRRLEIGGMTQSGGIVERIWKKGLPSCQAAKLPSCLVLGLGAGSVAKILSPNTKYQIPDTRIVGVEIDPEVVRLGQKYFGLGEIENLEIVVDDAVRFINKLSAKSYKQSLISGEIQLKAIKFDLILVDLYQGREIPTRCQSKKFLESLKKIKSKNGLIIFNRLYSKDKREETDGFVRKCREVFKEVNSQKAICNLMVFCK